MKKLIAAALTTFALAAHANSISTSINVAAGDVEYWAFDYTDPFLGGGVSVFTSGSSTLFTNDPHLCVFRGSLSAGNLVGCDDDSGSGPANSLLTFNTNWLSSGTYVIALSGYDLSVADALSGSNPDSSAVNTTLNVQSPGSGIFSNPILGNLREVNPVPLPGTLALLGAGLLGLGMKLRRKQA